MQRTLHQQPFPGQSDEDGILPGVAVASYVCCVFSAVIGIIALFQLWRFRKHYVTLNYKIVMLTLLVAHMIACFLSSLELGPVFLPLWLFFALEEHMYAFSIATFAVLTLFWIRFYCTIEMRPRFGFMDTPLFTIVSIAVPELYSIGVSIYFYKSVHTFREGWDILRGVFYIFHVSLFFLVSLTLLCVAVMTYMSLRKMTTRKSNKIKTVQILAAVSILTVFKSAVYSGLTYSYDNTSFGNFYWNTSGGIYIFFFLEHFIPSSVFLIILRKRPKTQTKVVHERTRIKPPQPLKSSQPMVSMI
jgi:hypothetical protein